MRDEAGDNDMNEHDDDPRLDALLQEYFAGRLNGQLGRAAERFRQGTNVSLPEPRPSRTVIRRGSLVGWTALAAAAAVLLIVARARFVAPPRPEHVIQPIAGQESSEPTVAEVPDDPVDDKPSVTPALVQTRQDARLLVERTVRTRTIDEGTVAVAGRPPLRKLRRQWFEREEWFDPVRGARVEQIVPHEEIVFVAMPVN